MCDASGFTDKLIMASSAVSSIGNLIEGRQAKSYYNYKADQAEADAAYERGAAEVRASKIRKAGVLQQAEVKAGYAGAGIDVGSGTPLTTAEAVQRNISEDATNTLYTGQRRANVLEAEAGGYRAAGTRAQTSSYLAAGRSLLTGTAASMDAATKRDKWIRKTNQEFAATKRAEFALGGGFEDAGM